MGLPTTWPRRKVIVVVITWLSCWCSIIRWSYCILFEDRPLVNFIYGCPKSITSWRHQMETVSALLALCVGNSKCHTCKSLQWRHNGRLKSTGSRVFTLSFLQSQIKENIKAPRHWPLCGEFTGDLLIPQTNGQWHGKCFHLMTSSY